MSRLGRALPSPALVVAIGALAAALAGTAVAERASTTASKSKLTSKQKTEVKKIAKKQGKKQGKNQANKQIKKKAPNLEVKSAKTAESATTAGTADTAKSAETATNAQTVGGKSSSQLETTSGYAEATGTPNELTGEVETIVETTVITTGTRLVANAAVNVVGKDSGGTVSCMIAIDSSVVRHTSSLCRSPRRRPSRSRLRRPSRPVRMTSQSDAVSTRRSRQT